MSRNLRSNLRFHNRVFNHANFPFSNFYLPHRRFQRFSKSDNKVEKNSSNWGDVVQLYVGTFVFAVQHVFDTHALQHVFRDDSPTVRAVRCAPAPSSHHSPETEGGALSNWRDCGIQVLSALPPPQQLEVGGAKRGGRVWGAK